MIAGFSRCAIGVNYLGLADDDVASLWAGSIAYAHYDGQPGDTNWSYPEPGLPASYERLRRLGSRPQFVCAERNGTAVTTKVQRVLWMRVCGRANVSGVPFPCAALHRRCGLPCQCDIHVDRVLQSQRPVDVAPKPGKRPVEGVVSRSRRPKPVC